jgi:glycogen synthase
VKILFLTTSWPRAESPIDGIFVREHALAAAERAEVAVVYLERAAAANGAVEILPPGERESPPVWRVRYRRFGRPLSYVGFIAGALAARRRLRGRGFVPDIVHANSFLSALPALVLGRIDKVPVVYTEHSTIFMPENPERLSPPMQLAARLALQRTDRVLPVSEALAEVLRKLAPRARLQVVPNAVDITLFHPDGRAAEERSPRLLTAGLLDTDHKGIDVLLNALARLPDGSSVRLEVVGDGARRESYERLAQSLGLDETVAFSGLKPKPELAASMREADLFVLASRYENNPCVLLEAMASGLPVVATSVGGVPEIVDQASGILVPPRDPDRLALAIDAALGRLRSFDREAIAHRACERFSRDAVGGRLAALYSELTAP